MSKIKLHWITSKTGEWLPLERVDLSGVDVKGAYIIWHGGNAGKVVRVGQGLVNPRLTNHRNDKQILAYSHHGLYVTWAVVAQSYLDGVEKFLAENLNPLIGDRFPDAHPVAVNFPWATWN